MRISALIALLPIIFSCASVGEAVVQKYREDGLPMWVESRFTNPSGYWAGFNDEGGYYASGKAKYGDAQSSTAAAELDAKANLCDFVAAEFKAERKDTASVSGIRRVDRLVSEDGTVHVLMFVSEKNAKKSFRR